MPREHPFDRYATFTDVVALKEWSAKPLRKSVRVDTLKCSVERFQEWAEEKGWKLEPVPWCGEGFWVDRPSAGSRSGPEPHQGRMAGQVRDALGKDLLHLIGGFYIQEAASMLPIELLDPHPGDAVLDMSAAPGSKTTQCAARMGGSGVILANDIQEHRLWTLKSSLHRSGVTNAIVTKKVGQWFGKHMTERFDRVLCDAPCTAQGAVRKDSDALDYCGRENIEKIARLQVQLLEAAIHATRVGGRIVYSTCTLTPEENEGVVGAILERFGGKVEIVDPRQKRLAESDQRLEEIFNMAIQDAASVQGWLGKNSSSSLAASRFPLLRLWPQTYDTEGFFCAVLEKRATTKEVEKMEWIPFQEERLPDTRQKEIGAKLEKLYGTDFFEEGDVLFQLGEQLFLTTSEVASDNLPVQNYALGLPFAKLLADGRVRLSHEMATRRGIQATRARCHINDEQLTLFLEGKDAPGDPELHGDVLLLYKDFCIGRALAKNSILKNNLPRWMVRD